MSILSSDFIEKINLPLSEYIKKNPSTLEVLPSRAGHYVVFIPEIYELIMDLPVDFIFSPEKYAQKFEQILARHPKMLPAQEPFSVSCIRLYSRSNRIRIEISIKMQTMNARLFYSIIPKKELCRLWNTNKARNFQ